MLNLGAIVLCAVAAFAQWRISEFTATRTRVWITRAFLFALGVAVGFVTMRNVQPGSIAWFLTGFGLVHVPPAIVLFLKGLRGEQPS